MIEMQLVDVPTQFPMACSCGNQKGPLVDTHREKLGAHEYVCLECGKKYASLFGLAPWKDVEEKAKIAQMVASLERELDVTRTQLKAERDESELKGRVIEDLSEKLDNAEGKIASLTERMNQAAEELVA